jgi:uncharacterized protein
MWIPRDVEARLQRSAKTRPAIVLTGARQTGKTSNPWEKASKKK